MSRAANSMHFRLPSSQYTPDRSVLSQHQSSHNTVDNEQSSYSSYGTLDGNGGRGHIYQTYAQDTLSNWTPFNPNGTLSPAPTLPTPTLPTDIPSTQSYVSPTTGPTTSFPYAETGYGADYSSLSFAFPGHGHRTSLPAYEGCQNGSAHGDWPHAGLPPSHEALPTLKGHHQDPSPSMPYQGPNQKLVSLHRNSPRESPSTWGAPLAVPIGQSTIEMAPPPVQHGSASQRQPLPLVLALPPSDHRKNRLATTEPRKVRAAIGSGQYIHALCGKGFHSRSAVKKHHWGNVKAGDASTTTGCWAKKNKPDREW